MVREPQRRRHRVEASHETGGAPVHRRGSSSVPCATWKGVAVCAMIGASIIGVAIGLAVVACINVALAGYDPIVLIYCLLWCFVIALGGLFLARGGE